jgi:hypothetical protein
LTTPSDFDRLEALMTRAIELDPEFANAYTLRSRALLSRLWVLSDLTDEQWTMIDSDIDSARRIAGDTEAVLAAQASLEYYGHMDYRRALETTRAALSRYPNDLLLQELEGLLLRRLGQWENAIDVFQELVDREPSNPSYVYTLVESLHSMRRYAEVISAVEAFERRAPAGQLCRGVGAGARGDGARSGGASSFLDTWRDRLDPQTTCNHRAVLPARFWTDRGPVLDAGSQRGKYIISQRTSAAAALMPFACLRGFGRMLQGAANAPEQAREVSAMAPPSAATVTPMERRPAQGPCRAVLGDRKSGVSRHDMLELMSRAGRCDGPANMAAAADSKLGRARATNQCSSCAG